MTASLSIRGNELHLSSPTSQIGIVKYVLDRVSARWHKVGAYYSIPLSVANIEELLQVSEIQPANNDIVKYLAMTEGDLNTPEIRVHRQWDKLYNFQKKVIWKLFMNQSTSYLIAMSFRLGKTIVSTIAADLLNYENVLIIAPKILIDTWGSEIRKWTFRYPVNCWGRDPQTGWCITTYETLYQGSTLSRGSLTPGKRLKSYCDIKWDLIIADESTRFKNPDSLTFETLLYLRKTSNSRVWALSGMPSTRDVSDLWSQFSVLNPKTFPSYWKFTDRFCITETSPWGTQIIGSKYGIDFRSKFRDLMISISIQDVLDEGEFSFSKPFFATYRVFLLSWQQLLYNSMLTTFSASAGDEVVTSPTIMAQLIRLQQIVSCPRNLGEGYPQESAKHVAVLELLSLYEGPFLVWTHWRMGAIILADLIRRAGYKTRVIIGGEENADYYLQEFRNGGVEVLVLSLDVGQFGLTLTNAETVIYLDKTFEMEAYVQSMYRTQTLLPVGVNHEPNVISIVAEKTTDELVIENLSSKAIDISRISGKDLAHLLRSLQ